MNEGWEKALMGLEKSLKIPEDVIDVMAQIKWPVENTTYLYTNVKKIKEMARALEEEKKSKAEVQEHYTLVRHYFGEPLLLDAA